MNKAPFAAAAICFGLLGACSDPYQRTAHSHDATVFYATNRKVTSDLKPEKTFGAIAAANETVTYGKAIIHIPDNHQLGSDKDVTISQYQPVSMSLDEFYKAVNSSELTTGPRNLLIYVHGFNNSFSDAAHRAGIFANDLQPNPAHFGVIYSWPSAESLFAYQKDEDSVQLNQSNLRRFVSNLHSRTKSERTILIGHSMGCRALTYALRDYFLEETIRDGWHIKPVFAELVFIEPDVDSEYFQQNLIGAKAICQRITIYTDSHDIALKASKILHQYQSLGLSGSALGKNVDIVDASAVRNNWLGHSYDGAAFFNDLHQVIQGVPAISRASLHLENEIYRLRKS